MTSLLVLPVAWVDGVGLGTLKREHVAASGISQHCAIPGDVLLTR
jgi:hypothetical protein